jgi:hypothetical protein
MTYCRKDYIDFQACNCRDCRNIVDNVVTNNSLVVKTDNLIYYPDTTSTECNLSNKSIIYLGINTISFMHLTSLDVSYNNINFIPDIHTIKKLKCIDCNLRELPSMPILEELDCSDNLLTCIPNYTKLIKLTCSHNLIESFPNLSIKKLICNNNPITSVNISTLTYLEAYGCPILAICKIPGLTKRSSILENGNFTWIIDRTEKLDKTNVVIDWNTNCTLLVKSKLFNKLFKN